MGWMAAVDRLTEQVVELSMTNMKLNEENKRLSEENQRLLSKLKKSEELADMLAPLVFEQEEE
jgi:cell division protein FtsB